MRIFFYTVRSNEKTTRQQLRICSAIDRPFVPRVPNPLETETEPTTNAPRSIRVYGSRILSERLLFKRKGQSSPEKIAGESSDSDRVSFSRHELGESSRARRRVGLAVEIRFAPPPPTPPPPREEPIGRDSVGFRTAPVWVSVQTGSSVVIISAAVVVIRAQQHVNTRYGVRRRENVNGPVKDTRERFARKKKQKTNTVCVSTVFVHNYARATRPCDALGGLKFAPT